jgi:hypothetical protein
MSIDGGEINTAKENYKDNKKVPFTIKGDLNQNQLLMKTDLIGN